jgi:hypothetical protein
MEGHRGQGSSGWLVVWVVVSPEELQEFWAHM